MRFAENDGQQPLTRTRDAFMGEEFAGEVTRNGLHEENQDGGGCQLLLGCLVVLRARTDALQGLSHHHRCAGTVGAPSVETGSPGGQAIHQQRNPAGQTEMKIYREHHCTSNTINAPSQPQFWTIKLFFPLGMRSTNTNKAAAIIRPITYRQACHARRRRPPSMGHGPRRSASADSPLFPSHSAPQTAHNSISTLPKTLTRCNKARQRPLRRPRCRAPAFVAIEPLQRSHELRFNRL